MVRSQGSPLILWFSYPSQRCHALPHPHNQKTSTSGRNGSSQGTIEAIRDSQSVIQAIGEALVGTLARRSSHRTELIFRVV